MLKCTFPYHLGGNLPADRKAEKIKKLGEETEEKIKKLGEETEEKIKKLGTEENMDGPLVSYFWAPEYTNL